MLREFADPSGIDRKSKKSSPAELPSRRTFIVQLLAIAAGSRVSPVKGQEPTSNRDVRSIVQGLEEQESTYRSIEEWLSCSKKMADVRDALSERNFDYIMQIDNGPVRDLALENIIFTVAQVAEEYNPVPHEIDIALQNAINRHRTLDAKLFLERIRIMTETMKRGPKRIPVIKYTHEYLQEALQKKLGLEIDIDEKMANVIVKKMSIETNSPAGVLTILILHKYFLTIDSNGGAFHIRPKEGVDIEQEALEHENTILIQSQRWPHAESMMMRPRNSGPILELDNTSNDLRFCVSISRDGTKGRDQGLSSYKVSIPMPPMHSAIMKPDEWPNTHATIHTSNHSSSDEKAPVLIIVHGVDPISIPLPANTVTRLMKIVSKREGGSSVITMIPNVEEDDPIRWESRVLALIGWSRFHGQKDGKDINLPVSVSRNGEEISFTVEGPPVDALFLDTFNDIVETGLHIPHPMNK